MKKYDDDDSVKYRKKPKHARNRPGEGMRVLNPVALHNDVELDINDGIDIYDDESYNYDMNFDQYD